MLWSYIEQLVLPELQYNVEDFPILKATCIKFVYMFRNQIPQNFVVSFLDLLANFLQSSSIVNQSYAAACIEKFLVYSVNG